MEIARERYISAERRCDSQLLALVAESCGSHFICVRISRQFQVSLGQCILAMGGAVGVKPSDGLLTEGLTGVRGSAVQLALRDRAGLSRETAG